jgi:hypothetical protein
VWLVCHDRRRPAQQKDGVPLKEAGKPVDVVYRQIRGRSRKPLSAIKTMKDDAATVEAQAEEIKARYTKYFGV